MEFIPLEVLQFPVYRGMLVSKIIQTIDPSTNTPHGPNMKLLQAGSIVQVTLQVTTPDALSSVMLVDLLPGGLEAIDPLLDGDSSLGEGYGAHTPRGRGGYYYSTPAHLGPKKRDQIACSLLQHTWVLACTP